MKKRLADFNKISVRETSGQIIVNDLCNKVAEVNLDPSLLLEAKEWEQIEEKTVIEDKYIFLFIVNKPLKMFEFAKKLANEEKLKIIFACDKSIKKDKDIIYINMPTLEQFIAYIHNAEYVITNSFHATAFSVIFNKKLFVEFETQTGRNTRAEELLNMLMVSGRDINEYGKANLNIDWNNANSILNQERQKAKKYLMSIIEKDRR